MNEQKGELMGNKYDDIFHNAYWELGDGASDEERTQHAYDVMGAAWNNDNQNKQPAQEEQPQINNKQEQDEEQDGAFKWLDEVVRRISNPEKAYAGTTDTSVSSPGAAVNKNIDQDTIDEAIATQSAQTTATSGNPKPQSAKNNISGFQDKWNAMRTLGIINGLEDLGLATYDDKKNSITNPNSENKFSLSQFFDAGSGKNYYDNGQISGSVYDAYNAMHDGDMSGYDDLVQNIKNTYGIEADSMQDLVNAIYNQTTNEMSKAKSSGYDDLAQRYIGDYDLDNPYLNAEDVSISPSEMAEFQNAAAKELSGKNTFMHMKNIKENPMGSYVAQLQDAGKNRADTGYIGRNKNDKALFAELNNITQDTVGGKSYQDFKNKGAINLADAIKTNPGILANISNNNEDLSNDLSLMLAYDYNWNPNSNADAATEAMKELLGSDYDTINKYTKGNLLNFPLTSYGQQNEYQDISKKINDFKGRNAQKILEGIAISNPNLQGQVAEEGMNPYSQEYVSHIPGAENIYSVTEDPFNMDYSNLFEMINDNTVQNENPTWDSEYLKKVYSKLKKRG